MSTVHDKDPVYTQALGLTDTTETSFLFQKWDDGQWSRGSFCETLEEARSEQASYQAMTLHRARPTRIVKVVTATGYQALVQ